MRDADLGRTGVRATTMRLISCIELAGSLRIRCAHDREGT
jgi:hypothetical protein